MAITQSLNRKSSNPKENTACLCESGRTLVGKDLLAGLGGDTVREREFQALGEELLDVRAADALAVLDLDDAEDLSKSVSGRSFSQKLIENVRGWSRSGHGDGQPCPGTKSRRHQFG